MIRMVVRIYGIVVPIFKVVYDVIAYTFQRLLVADDVVVVIMMKKMIVAVVFCNGQLLLVNIIIDCGIYRQLKSGNKR